MCVAIRGRKWLVHHPTSRTYIIIFGITLATISSNSNRTFTKPSWAQESLDGSTDYQSTKQRLILWSTFPSQTQKVNSMFRRKTATGREASAAQRARVFIANLARLNGKSSSHHGAWIYKQGKLSNKKSMFMVSQMEPKEMPLAKSVMSNHTPRPRVKESSSAQVHPHIVLGWFYISHSIPSKSD